MSLAAADDVYGINIGDTAGVFCKNITVAVMRFCQHVMTKDLPSYKVIENLLGVIFIFNLKIGSAV